MMMVVVVMMMLIIISCFLSRTFEVTACTFSETVVSVSPLSAVTYDRGSQGRIDADM
jgi:hypothetical protein